MASSQNDFDAGVRIPKTPTLKKKTVLIFYLLLLRALFFFAIEGKLFDDRIVYTGSSTYKFSFRAVYVTLMAFNKKVGERYSSNKITWKIYKF